jgi:hypothetical protein
MLQGSSFVVSIRFRFGAEYLFLKHFCSCFEMGENILNDFALETESQLIKFECRKKMVGSSG